MTLRIKLTKYQFSLFIKYEELIIKILINKEVYKGRGQLLKPT